MSTEILAGLVSHYVPRGLGFGVSFSHNGRVFVLQVCYQHPMSNQQHQRTQDTK